MFGKSFGAEKGKKEEPKVDMHQANDQIKEQIENIEMRAKKIGNEMDNLRN